MVDNHDDAENPGGARPFAGPGADPIRSMPGPGTYWPTGPDPETARTWGSASPTRTRNPWKLWQKAAAGATLAAVVGVGGVAAVSAANASSEAGTAGIAGQGADGYRANGYGGPAMADGGRADFGGPREAMALAGALHGDFVVQTDGTATETRRLQNGSVTALSAGSLTVTSSDGYVGNYTVPTDLELSDVAVGDDVRVLATVAADTATVISVHPGSAEAADGEGRLPDLPEGMTPPNAPESAPQTS
ncbi:hypothetical protein ACVBEQ_02460 [Nakamurella sp. GG22]